MFFKQTIRLILRTAILILLVNTHCKERIEYTDDGYFGGKVMILGHRGMGVGFHMPGNTYESISPAIAIGTDGCEMDIQLTKDTVLVLYHDDMLNSSTTCTGRVYESNWEEIKKCRYSTMQNTIFINSVDELFSKIPNINQLYFSFDCGKVDIEVSDINLYQNQYLRAIKRLCDKYDMSNNIFLEGSESLFTKAKNLGLSNKLFLFGNVDKNTIDTAVKNNFFGISSSIECLKEYVELAHQKGLYVMLWSPGNFTQNKETLAKKADIIQTDDPITILKLLKRYNYEHIIP